MLYNSLPNTMKLIAPYFLFLALCLSACEPFGNNAASIPSTLSGSTPTVVATSVEIKQAAPSEKTPSSHNYDVISVPTETTQTVTSDEIPATPEIASPPTAYPTVQELPDNLPMYGYRVINKYPHDRAAFTQGLVVADEGVLLEGTGWWGRSSLGRTRLETGEIFQYQTLPEQYFGEGITEFGDRIFQLTWKSGTGVIYDSESFEPLDSFNYSHEGWGITHDGEKLIVSDGSDILRFWDPQTMTEIGRIQVAVQLFDVCFGRAALSEHLRRAFVGADAHHVCLHTDFIE